VVFPIYKSTFERGDGLTSDYPNTTSAWRDHVVAWAKDVSRTIDYIESRDDFERARVGFYGYSWGAAMAPVYLAIEPRFKAATSCAAASISRTPRPRSIRSTSRRASRSLYSCSAALRLLLPARPFTAAVCRFVQAARRQEAVPGLRHRAQHPAGGSRPGVARLVRQVLGKWATDPRSSGQVPSGTLQRWTLADARPHFGWRFEPSSDGCGNRRGHPRKKLRKARWAGSVTAPSAATRLVEVTVKNALSAG